jgi:predicted transcriptional regulator
LRPSTPTNRPTSISVPGVKENVIQYHLNLLLEENYIVAEKTGYQLVYPSRLTSKGHDFIDAAKNEGIWNNAKEFLKNKGVTVTLDIVKDLLISSLKDHIGLK